MSAMWRLFLIYVVCMSVILASGLSILDTQKIDEKKSSAKQSLEPPYSLDSLQESTKSQVSSASPRAPRLSISVPKKWQGEPYTYGTASDRRIPVFRYIPTEEPVVFLGIDDGMIKKPEFKEWLNINRLPFSLFLDWESIKDNPGYFKDLQKAGMAIQNHSLTHRDLTKLPFEEQKAEICGASDKIEEEFGARPTLFRPPFGEYSDLTIQAAAECGIKAVIMWHAKANGGSIQFQYGNTSFLPGDIVLMHFRNEFIEDMKAFTSQVKHDNLQVGRLEDWIK